MNKKDRIKEIIDEVRKTVLPTEIIKVSKKVGASYTSICPFHGGRKTGSFMVSNEKGIFKCFNCGVKGDVIKFESLTRSKNYVESALDIARMYNIITEAEFQKLSYRKMKTSDVKEVELHFDKKDENKYEKKNLKAENHVLDDVYSLFIKAIEEDKKKLSKEHMEYLLKRCSKEQIEKVSYFTFPNRYVKKSFFKLLSQNNYDLSVLSTIPGFFYDEKKKQYDFCTSKAIGIPIRNEVGQIIAIQKRFDKVDEGQCRYRWFTSSFSEYGCSPGASIEVVYPKEIKNNTLFITEGHFKAYKIADTFNSPALSVPGVQSWRSVVSKVDNLLSSSNNSLKKYIKNIFITFDADMSSNLGVLSSAISLGYALSEKFKMRNLDIKITFVLWDSNLGKGIDDFLENNHSIKENLVKVNLNAMIEKTYEYIVSLAEGNKKLLKEKYNEEYILKETPSAERIFSLSTKYWAIFKEIDDKEKDLNFKKFILNK